MLFAIGCWVFYETAYCYHFFYKEQNQLFLLSSDYVSTYRGCGWLGRLAGDYLTQYFYYRYAGAAILSACLLAMGASAYGGLRLLKLNCWAAMAVALLLMAIEAVFQLDHRFPLSGTMAACGWTVMLYVAALAASKTGGAWWLRCITALPTIALAAWCFGIPQMGRIASPEWQEERMMAIDNEYRFGNYDKVTTLVEKEPSPTDDMKFFYNLAMAQRGELPDHLLRFVPNELGTLHRIGPDTPVYTIKNMNELYWVLGDMTFCERAAMMACVFSPANRNVRMVKRLAEANIVSGDTLAANKYLKMLGNTAAYSKWAANAWQQKEYRQKAKMRNLQDTLAITDNSHFIMMQLLDSNPDNTLALDYMLCTELLLKDIDNFKRDYDRYCSKRPRVKKLYQEALCIWLAGTSAPPEEWQRLINMPDVARRFQQYNRQRGSTAFKDTYWYYFDK